MPDLSLFAEIPPAELPLSQHDPTATCAHCGAEHHAGDSNRTPDNEVYCPDCAYCEHCNTLVSRDDTMDHNGQSYCTDCVHTCEGCDNTQLGEAFDTAYTSIHRRGEGCFCSECAWTCDDCGDRYENNVENYTPLGTGNTICPRCYANNYCEDCQPQDDEDQDDEDDRLIHPHDYKPDPRFLPHVGLPVYFGMEIEVDRPDRDYSQEKAITHAGLNQHDSWYLKSDGSLIHGFECVSQPGTWEHWREATFDWCAKLVEKGYRSYDTTTCGMHIHVSKSWLTPGEQLKLLMFFRANAHIVTRLSRRKGDEWHTYARIESSTDTRRLVKKVKDGPDTRYEAINLEPDNTVEFRIFRGTLNVKSIKRNLALVVALCAYVKESKRTQLSFSQFCTWLVKHGERVLGHAAMACELHAWVRDASRGNLPDDDGE